ncbi:MAG: Sensor histidine kinase YpdA [Spirochaetes bacterium ADurb.Bin315]|nr:MAG: Sensor histidine kinase YpdA [Spirochaetes bacterium ADurb.Bin315]
MSGTKKRLTQRLDRFSFKLRNHTFFRKLLLSYLLIAVVPLLLVGPFAYYLTKTILMERTRSNLETQASLALGQTKQLVDDAILIVEAVSSDINFYSLFTESFDETTVLNSLFLLLTNWKYKPGVHIIRSDGKPIISSSDIPQEYTNINYLTWGVWHRAKERPNNPILYFHQPSDVKNRVLSIGLYTEKPDFSGLIVLDLYENHLQEIVEKLSIQEYPYLGLFDPYRIHVHALNGEFDLDDREVVRNELLSTTSSTFQNKSRLYTIHEESGNRFFLVSLHPLHQINEILNFIKWITVILTSSMVLLSIILALTSSKNASEPLMEVVRCLRRVSEGDFSARTSIESTDEFGVLGSIANQLAVDMHTLIETNKQKEESLRVAMLKSLQAQTKPHFVFNSLELIKWYIMLGESELAIDTILDLGYLMRSTLDLSEGVIRVEEELQIIKHYLAIQKRRLGNRLNISITIDPALEKLPIPRFLLQPLVENAVMHGLERKQGAGMLTILGKDEGDVASFTFIDDGVGMSEGIAEELITIHKIPNAMKEGTGVQNIVRRLQLYYHGNAQITIDSAPMKGTAITMVIPKDEMLWTNG